MTAGLRVPWQRVELGCTQSRPGLGFWSWGLSPEGAGGQGACSEQGLRAPLPHPPASGLPVLVALKGPAVPGKCHQLPGLRAPHMPPAPGATFPGLPSESPSRKPW